MALTICGICDRSYIETHKACIHCGKTTAEQIAHLQGYSKSMKDAVDHMQAPFVEETPVASNNLFNRAIKWLHQ